MKYCIIDLLILVTILAQKNTLESQSRKIKELETIRTHELNPQTKTQETLQKEVENTIGNLQQYVNDIKSRTRKHIGDLCQLSFLTEAQLQNVSKPVQSAPLDGTEECATSTESEGKGTDEMPVEKSTEPPDISENQQNEPNEIVLNISNIFKQTENKA
jgi:hypothetical protein